MLEDGVSSGWYVARREDNRLTAKVVYGGSDAEGGEGQTYIFTLVFQPDSRRLRFSINPGTSVEMVKMSESTSAPLPESS
jgi:hypothetical protein